MRQNKSYFHGAMLLLFSGLTVKLLGALFKIPLTNLIGDSGMGLFSFSLQFFSIAFVLCAAGIPIAEACLVSESLALGNVSRARQLVLRITFLFTSFSAAVSAVLFAFAEQICSAFGEPDAAMCIRAVAPAIALVTAEAGLRGWYQGTSDMQPTSTSQILEAVGKLFFGLFFAKKAFEYNLGAVGAAAGAVLGVTAGEAMAVIYLVFSARHGILPALKSRSHREHGMARRFMSLMLPVTLGAAVMTASGFLDMAIIFRRLPLTGMTQTEITSAYGAYTGMALTLYNLPQAFASAIAVSLLPALSSAWTKHSIPACQRLISSAVRMTLLVGIPCGAVLTAFAKPFLCLLFPSQPHGVQTAEILLSYLGLSESLVGLSAVTTSVLQSLGRPDLSVCSTAVGCAVKLVFSYVFMAEWGIIAAPLGNLLCFGIILLIDFCFIRNILHWSPDIFRPAFRFFTASCAMVFSGVGIFRYHLAIIGLPFSLLISAFAMTVIYAAVLFPLGGWTAEDLRLLPFGNVISERFRR